MRPRHVFRAREAFWEGAARGEGVVGKVCVLTDHILYNISQLASHRDEDMVRVGARDEGIESGKEEGVEEGWDEEGRRTRQCK